VTRAKSGQENVFFLYLIKHCREDVLRDGGIAPGSLMGGGYRNLQQNLCVVLICVKPFVILLILQKKIIFARIL
jgi:hypothetical protein